MGTNEWHVERRSTSDTDSPLAPRRDVLETGTLSIVVLGASGDLAKKKTFPALFHLYKQDLLPSDEVHIFGYARSKISTDELRNKLQSYLIPKKDASPKDLHDVSDFLQLVKYISGGYDSEEGFRLLDIEISEHEYLKNSKEGSSRRLFYLALPPSVYPSVCKMIKTYCMNKSDLGGWTRVVVEKPFGRDLESAEELSNQIGELFEEPQIYRIDHYLGKELVQNMLVLRFANRFFLPLWNRDNIDNVQIVFREDFGKNPSSITVVPPPLKLNTTTAFGSVRMIDNPLTLGPELSSKLVGKSQGFYASACQDQIGLLMAMNLAFIEGKYNGSSITILGRNSVYDKVREMPVIGGSGLFRFARGYAQANTYSFDLKSGDAVVEYNVYVFHY